MQADPACRHGRSSQPTGHPGFGIPRPPALRIPFDPDAPFDTTTHRRDVQYAVRLGLAQVRTIGDKVAEQIVAERDRGGPYADMGDLVRRPG